MEAFNILKHKMIQAPVLALHDFTQPFVLETDACAYGIGVVLMHRGRPISSFSKSIGPRESAMSTYDKESLTIIEALKHWKDYFATSSLIISLKYIQEQKLREGIKHKLLVKFMGYNCTIEYKQGNKNRVDDALSRVQYKIHSLISARTSYYKSLLALDLYKTMHYNKECRGAKIEWLLEQITTPGLNLYLLFTFLNWPLGVS